MRMHDVTISSTHSLWNMNDEDKDNTMKKFYAGIREIIPDIPDEKITEKQFGSDNVRHIITDEQLIQLTLDTEYSLSIHQTMTLSTTSDFEMVANKFEIVAKRLEQISEMVDQSQHHYNQKCEVHTPGNALTMYNRLDYHTDMCTEEMQEILNKGWRIVAVCPQPDQRRPDYIVGKYDPDWME